MKDGKLSEPADVLIILTGKQSDLKLPGKRLTSAARDFADVHAALL